MALEIEEHRQRHRGINVVVYDQDSLGRCLGRVRSRATVLRMSDARQADLESRATAESGAVSSDLTAVHLDQLLDHSEADTEAALRAVERSVALYEKIENVRQQRR